MELYFTKNENVIIIEMNECKTDKNERLVRSYKRRKKMCLKIQVQLIKRRRRARLSHFFIKLFN